MTTERATPEAAKAARKLREICETATKLGFELGKAEGRKEAGEEIAQALEKMPPLCHTFTVGRVDAVAIAREYASQPQEATPEPLTGHTENSDLPEDSQGLSNRNPPDLTKGGQ